MKYPKIIDWDNLVNFENFGKNFFSKSSLYNQGVAFWGFSMPPCSILELSLMFYFLNIRAYDKQFYNLEPTFYKEVKSDDLIPNKMVKIFFLPPFWLFRNQIWDLPILPARHPCIKTMSTITHSKKFILKLNLFWSALLQVVIICCGYWHERC